jgi:putative membrane-bound dehydrogenase-like protein
MPRLVVLLVLLSTTAPVLGQKEPLSPEQSLARIKMPDGFRVTLFAGEPDLRKPIAMTLDDRGRLWVIENASYPHWLPEGKTGKDRILIFEDSAGKGHFDSCKVFLDNGTNLSGITVGFGGVWLCATPDLLFIPIKPGEDKPAGPAEVVLNGWDRNAKHNVFNSLTWGPDGWLYGCNGILATSYIGKPGTPKKERIPLNCGVWRYHPIRKTFEVFAWGTTNPWGLDFDAYGEMFITNCVIKHIFHVLPGAHFVRMYGQDLNPFCYGLIESCADHLHWAGGPWTSSRGGEGAHGDSGGGHAHAGAMVYLGDNWPDRWRGQVFMGNIHGSRLNMDLLKRQGSGYVSSRGLDIMFAHDSWFRPLSLFYGPDGGVFVADWHDTGECHNNDKTHPSGRIYKVTYGAPAAVNVDVAAKSDLELVELQKHRNDWFARKARRLLQERAALGKVSPQAALALHKMLQEETTAPRQLRALWALYALRGLSEKDLVLLLDHKEESVRGWAVRLLLEECKASGGVLAKLLERARKDPSPLVRLALASALQRLPLEQRWDLAESLAAHGEDMSDANLPLMLWYGIEPLVPADPNRAAALLAKAKIPLIREYIARRLADMAE